MANPQLVEYVGQQQAAGIPEDDIRKVLQDQHWSEEDINGAFAVQKLKQMQQIPIAAAPAAAAVAQPESKIWSKSISGANKGTLWVSCVLVFGLDLVILVMSGMSLFMFWAEMVVVLAIFCGFYLLEERVYKPRFQNSTSKIDGWILSLVSIRNFCVMLNAIPGIQILGALLLLYGIVPYLVVYALLIWLRSRRTAVSG